MAFTKILGPGIHTLANFHSHNINSSGIITATKFVGDMTVGGGSTGTFSSLTITGNLGVGGTITYTDVTNVDAIGIITAQSGIHFGIGATVGKVDAATGITTFSSSVGIADSIFHIGNNDTSIRFPSDDTFAVETAGSEALRISSAGNVGIGEDNPGHKLNIKNAAACIVQVESTNSNTSSIIQLLGKNSSGTVRTAKLAYDNADEVRLITPDAIPLCFLTQNGERLRITSTGALEGQTAYAAVGINTFAKFTRTGGGGPHLEIGYNAVTTDYGYFGTGTAHDLGLRTNDVTRLRITTGGDVQFFGVTAGVTSCLWDASANTLIFNDDVKTAFGNGSDLQISHSAAGAGSDTIDSSSGYMYINSDALRLNSKTSAWNYLRGDKSDGVVKLYKSNSEKLATSATGISVTGEVAATQDYPDFKAALDFNFAAVKKLDPRITYYRTGAASYINEFGLVQCVGANTPRFDHDPVTRECKGLLIEDQRINYVSYSEDITQANNSGVTITNNIATSPDGTQNASSIVGSGSDTNTNINWGTQTVASGHFATWSIFVKSTETSCILQFYTNTFIAGAARLNVELADGTTGGDAVNGNTWFWKVEEYPNSWWRVSWGGTGAGSGGGMHIGVVPAKTSARGATCGSAVNKTYYAWGVQEEHGAGQNWASSYIRTNGSAATRGGDFVSITGDEHTDFWNTSEGTYIIDYNPIELAVGDGVIIGSKRGSNGSGYPWPLYRHDTANTNIFKSYDLDTGIVSISSAWVDQQESWALGFNGTNGSIARNGSQLITNNTSMKGLINATELWLGSSSTGSLYSMHVKRFMYYPKRISDSQLVTLTS